MKKTEYYTEVELNGFKAELKAAWAEFYRADTKFCAVIHSLIDRNISPSLIVEWSDEIGYDKQYARNVISRYLITNGKRRRAAGAGRKVSGDAQSIAKWATEQWGDNAASKLLAAYRLLKGKTGAKK